MIIYYVTRTLLDTNDGGSVIRKGTVTNLINKGYKVIVVAPNYNNNHIIHTKSSIFIPINKNTRILSYAEHIGIIEDYLQFWAKRASKYLKKYVKDDDIVFCTSGGELGTIMLGYYLKKEVSCKFLVNFHDPLGYTTIYGKLFKISQKFHVSRDSSERKYLSSVDAIVTSTKFYAESLKKKYPILQNRVYCNYFGYIDKTIYVSEKKPSNVITIAYGGAMGHLQSPEILAYASRGFSNVKVIFIGNVSYFKKFDFSGINVEFYDSMNREAFLQFLSQNVDIGFLSLSGEISNYCIPSKLYDYINIGLPVLASISGDSADIINRNDYGLACPYDESKLRECIRKYSQEKNIITKYKANVLRDKDKWYMGNLISELCFIIDDLK